MEIGVQKTARPTQNGRAFACVGRARHSVRADQGPQTIDYRSPVRDHQRFR